MSNITADNLMYAARARCKTCGAGLAYLDIWNEGFDWQHRPQSWQCSAVLLGEAKDGEHEEYPFAFYEIKSEHQPSANGETTRPGGVIPESVRERRRKGIHAARLKQAFDKHAEQRLEQFIQAVKVVADMNGVPLSAFELDIKRATDPETWHEYNNFRPSLD